MWSKWLEMRLATPMKLMEGYDGTRSPWETMFICLLYVQWTANGIPSKDCIGEIEALRMYEMANDLSDVKESRATSFRRKKDVQMIATYVMNKMRNDLGNKIENRILQIQEYTQELTLLDEMKFPISQIDWLVANELDGVGRLGIYDQLLEDDKSADWTNEPFDQELIKTKGIR
jgi:hypothetical protein